MGKGKDKGDIVQFLQQCPQMYTIDNFTFGNEYNESYTEPKVIADLE